MNINKSKWIAALLLGFCLSNVYAQQAMLTSGGVASGSGGSVSCSVGQIVYTSNTGPGGSVNQGMQEAYEIIPLEIKKTVLTSSLSVFPNPVKDKLILSITNFNNEKLVYQLFDVQGQLVMSKRIDDNQTEINTGDLPSAGK
jgi:hypothetical protein